MDESPSPTEILDQQFHVKLARMIFESNYGACFIGFIGFKLKPVIIDIHSVRNINHEHCFNFEVLEFA